MENISENITYAEATRSSSPLPNHPSPEQIVKMKYVASKVFQPLRKHFGGPIGINSFFRSPAVNKDVGGAVDAQGNPTSQHCKGEAMDISGTKYGVSNAEIFEHILINLPFDQLIWEFGNDDEPAWVHVSCKKSGNRKQVLKAVKRAGKTVYVRM